MRPRKGEAAETQAAEGEGEEYHYEKPKPKRKAKAKASPKVKATPKKRGRGKKGNGKEVEGSSKKKKKASPKKKAEKKTKKSPEKKSEKVPKKKQTPKKTPKKTRNSTQTKKAEGEGTPKKRKACESGKATFAKRYEPTKTSSKIWWGVLAKSFEAHIKEHVSKFSKHEDLFWKYCVQKWEELPKEQQSSLHYATYGTLWAKEYAADVKDSTSLSKRTYPIAHGNQRIHESMSVDQRFHCFHFFQVDNLPLKSQNPTSQVIWILGHRTIKAVPLFQGSNPDELMRVGIDFSYVSYKIQPV